MAKIVVIGGTSGLGEAICDYLAPHYEVEALSRRTGFDIRTDARDIRCDGLVICLRDREHFGTQLLQTELVGPAMVLEHLQGWCQSVVLVSSVAAQSVVSEQDWDYHAAKAGVEAITRYFAVNLAPIRVNAVAPGTIKGPDDGEKWRFHNDFRENHIPRGMTTRLEVAEVVRWLLDPACPLTGEVLTVDGGASLLNTESLLGKVYDESVQAMQNGDQTPNQPRTDASRPSVRLGPDAGT